MRRSNPEKLQVAKAEFASMIAQGVCRPSNSQWASPLHFVPKKNGTWRSGGDYRWFNNVTIPDMYPILYLQDFSYKLQGCKIFTTLDLSRAYHHIPVGPEDVPKAAVITPFGSFQFRVMTFGLKKRDIDFSTT